MLSGPLPLIVFLAYLIIYSITSSQNHITSLLRVWHISDHDYELLWMSSPQSPQRTVMTFITFPESPTAATDDAFPFEFPVLKGLCWVRNLLVCTLSAETFSAVEWLSLILWLPLIAIKQPEIPFMLSDFHFSLSLTEILILKFKGDKYPYFCTYLCEQCFQ